MKEEGREYFRIWSQKAVLSDPLEAAPAGVMEKVKCGEWQADVLTYPPARKGSAEKEFMVLSCASAVPDSLAITAWEELAQDLNTNSGCIYFCDAAELKKRGRHVEWLADFKDDLASTDGAMIRDFDAGARTKEDKGAAKCWVCHDAQQRVIAVKIALQLHNESTNNKTT